MNLKRSIERRKAILGKLRFNIKNAADVTSETSQEEMNIRLNKLKTIESEFDTINASLEDFDEYEAGKDLEEKNDIENQLIIAYAHLQILVTKPETETQKPDQPSVESAATKSDFKLPNITIPKFDGNYQKWCEFHDFFEAAVNNAPGLSNVQKLHHLKSNLKDEAFELISYLPTTDNNYSIAWDLLKKRYHNLRSIVNAHLHKLFDQPALTQENSKDIKRLLDTTNECLNAIKALDVPTQDWDPLIVHFDS